MWYSFPTLHQLSGYSNLNRTRNPVGWWKKASISVNLGYVAGLVATKQLNEKRHFTCENPAGPMLYQPPPWRKLGLDSRIHRTVMHQCAAGLTDHESQKPIKKPTEFWASGFCLIEWLSQMQYRCTLQHATLEGAYKGVARTHMARVWPWKLAAAVAS